MDGKLSKENSLKLQRIMETVDEVIPEGTRLSIEIHNRIFEVLYCQSRDVK